MLKIILNQLPCCFFVTMIFIVSCNESSIEKPKHINIDSVKTVEKEKDSIVKNGNITTIISSNIGELSKLMDLRYCKPTYAKYKYTFIDNSGEDKRLSVPGPSDHYLEALLYFDSATAKYISDFSLSADYVSPNCSKQDFKFDWLDKDILNELEKSDSSYHGIPDMFFGSLKGKGWYLDKKMLYKTASY